MKNNTTKMLAEKLNMLLKHMGPHMKLDELSLQVGARVTNEKTGDGQNLLIQGHFTVRDFNTKNELCRYYPPATQEPGMQFAKEEQKKPTPPKG